MESRFKEMFRKLKEKDETKRKVMEKETDMNMGSDVENIRVFF